MALYKSKSKTKTLTGNPLIGLDIGSRAVHLVVGRKLKDTVEVTCMDFDSGLGMNTTDGKVASVSAVKGLLMRILNKNRIALKNVTCSVESLGLIKRELVVPNGSDEDITGLVSYEIANYLPIDVSSYVIQHKKLGVLEQDGQEMQKILVAAMPKGIVESYVELLGEAGLYHYSMETNATVIPSLLALGGQGGANRFSGRNVAMIDMGHSMFNISFYENGEYVFNRLLEIGGRQVDQAIANLFNVEVQEAEEIKLNLCNRSSVFDFAKQSLPMQGQPVLSRDDKLVTEMFYHINSWFDEVESVLRYYMTRNRNSRIDEIILHGGCAQIRDIDLFFEKRSGIKASVLRSVDSVRVNSGGVQDISRFINAISCIAAI